MSYNLAVDETVWTDDCSICPDYMIFHEESTCDRQTVVDGVCYRGDWSDDNGYFKYVFELPPQWGTYDFRYKFKYWALGTWEKGQEQAVAYPSKTSSGGASYFNLFRNSETQCANWQTWQPSDGALDPYSMWQAADGGIGLNLTCYVSRSYPRIGWTDSPLYVGFAAKQWGSAFSLLSGPRTTEAWVVSDFQIEFFPQTVITNSYYDLGAAEYKWADPCSECLPSIEFQASTSRMMCETLVSSDDRCFRGAFGFENDFIVYLFQLPLAWDFPVDFHLNAIFWALGSWDMDANSVESAVVEHCDDDQNSCTRHLLKPRDSVYNCDGWQQWSQPTDNSTFTPLQWPAATWNGSDTACFWPVNVSVSGWTADKLKIRFGVFDTAKDEWGLSGTVPAEAWVVSDFNIEFCPQNRPCVTTRVPTTTTSKPSTTTTLKPTTTRSKPSTTTTATPTTTMYLSSTTPETSTLLPETTNAVASTEVNTSHPKTTWMLTSTDSMTTTADSNAKGNDSSLLLFAALIAGGVALFALFACIAAIAFYAWNKKKPVESVKESPDSLDRDGSIHLEESYSGPIEAKDPNVVFIEVGAKAKVKQSKLAKFSAKTEKQSAIEMLVMSETRCGSDEQITATGITEHCDTGTVGDAVADADIEDEMMYFAGSDWPTANGRDAATAGMREETPEEIVIRVRSHSDSLIEDQPEGVRATEGWSHATGTAARGHGTVGDAVADEDLEDEMLYFAGSDWPTAN